MLRFFYGLPQALRVFLIKRALANPFRSKAMMGTELEGNRREQGLGGRVPYAPPAWW